MKNVILAIVLIPTLFLFSCKSSQTALLSSIDHTSFSKIESGSNVKLKKGVYHLESRLEINSKENITIDGNGSTFIMKSLSDDVISIQDSKNITLKNFTATHIEPDGPVGCTGNVILISKGSNILIEKCELNGSGIVGVSAYETENLKIKDNYIHKNSQYGIIYQGPSVEITGNTFENNANGNLYFSYNNLNWPPQDLINSDTNKEGLKMSGNIYK